MSTETTTPAAPRILLVTSNYPNERQPHIGTFVAALAHAWHRAGVPVTVVAPEPLLGRRGFTPPTTPEPETADRPRVLRPRYPSFSAKTIAPGISTRRLTQWSFERAALGAVVADRPAADVVYGHFLFPAGAAALRIARRLGVPAVAAIGESAFDHWHRDFGPTLTRSTLDGLDGLLSVSEENAELLTSDFGVARERVRVVPNAVDTDHFRPRDREAARRRLGLPLDRRIVAFTGHFIERKGPLRLQAALARHPEVAAVYLGAGAQQPSGPQLLHAGRVPHDDVPIWLAAADLFAFPTLAEGSPNAVIEAMACGLPVVSSDIPSLRETVPPEAGRLVDPMDADALAEAIGAFMEDDAARERASRRALELARGRSLPERARRIAAWLSEIVAASDGRG